MLILTPWCLGRHHTGVPNLKDILSSVCSDKYHSESVSNRLWWIWSMVSEFLSTTNWCFHWDLSPHLRSPPYPTQNLPKISLKIKASFIAPIALRKQIITHNVLTKGKTISAMGLWSPCMSLISNILPRSLASLRLKGQLPASNYSIKDQSWIRHAKSV